MPAKRIQASGTCPICGKEYRALGAHTRSAHGKGLRELGLAKQPGRSNGDVLLEVNGSGEFTELSQFKVLQDRQGNVWIAERIR